MAETLMIWPGNPAMSVVVWIVLLSALLYFARYPAHRAILSLSRVLYSAMRLAAASVMHAERKLGERNREVLLAAGREAAERIVEREFDRVDASVQRELAEYPHLHRRLGELVGSIDRDYQASTEVPPAPPGWVKAVEAVAKIPSQGDPMVGNILKDINDSLNKAQTRALEEYRKSSHERHVLLKKMMPFWRRMLSLLGKVDKNITTLNERARSIDRHMDEYEGMVRATDPAVRMLSSSSLTQFFISAFVLAIAIGGALINFQLIAHPMSEMVGAESRLNFGFGVVETSHVAALVLILVEVAIGLFLMESLRITRLFPVIGALNDKTRIRMVWITFGILLILASVEAGLAYMREILAQDNQALVAEFLRNGDAATAPSSRWITTAAQMGMGFILPFALTFVAIPLETFVHSLRTVLGIAAVGLLRGIALACRLLGNVARQGGTLLVQVYDLLIFAPLWIERVVPRNGRRAGGEPGDSDVVREV